MDVLELTKRLIACPSVTPDEAGCMAILSDVLTCSGFACRRIDGGGTSNLVATWGDPSATSILLNGHCDVVPPGPLESWRSSPFEPHEEAGHLFGRGAADMKGSLAAMIVAGSRFVQETDPLKAHITILVTSDEEGPGTFGTGFALGRLLDEGARFDFALVGEPTSESTFGDAIKIGRRGSLSAKVRVIGKQGHVAYPHLAMNAIHLATPLMQALIEYRWDEPTAEFGASSLQIADVRAGAGALNLIPGELEFSFNIRYQPAQSPEKIQKIVSELIHQRDLVCEITWTEGARPFLTRNVTLIAALSESILEVTGASPRLSTGGGTSDARFIAARGIPVCEFGPLNTTIHAANECIAIVDLERTSDVYLRLLQKLI